MEKYCYATLLSTDDYLGGVLGLYFSLKKVNSQYPFIVLITDNVKEQVIEKIKNLNIEYKIVKCYCFDKQDTYYLDIEHKERYKTTLNKFHIYDLKEYEKVLFLDADIIILNNIDNIFKEQVPAFYIVNNELLSGTYFMISPKEYNFIDFLKYQYKVYTDEDIFRKVYNINKVNSLTVYESNIFHFSHNDIIKKYWFYYNLNSIESVINFINNFELNQKVVDDLNNL